MDEDEDGDDDLGENLDEYEDDDNVNLMRGDETNNRNHLNSNGTTALFEAGDEEEEEADEENFGDDLGLLNEDEDEDENQPAGEDVNENDDNDDDELLHETSLSELRRNLIDSTNQPQCKSTNRRKTNRVGLASSSAAAADVSDEAMVKRELKT